MRRRPKNYPPKTNCVWSAGKDPHGVTTSAVVLKENTRHEDCAQNYTGYHERNDRRNSKKTKHKIKHYTCKER